MDLYAASASPPRRIKTMLATVSELAICCEDSVPALILAAVRDCHTLLGLVLLVGLVALIAVISPLAELT